MKKGREIKPHIGIFGRRNNGKSSFINSFTGQYTAIVSDVAGTTTDPVKKSIEIHGIGPVVMIDTAGIEDVGDLGKQRVEKSLETIKHIDIAILLITENNFDKPEYDLINRFTKLDVPFIVVHNKADIEKANDELIHTLKVEGIELYDYTCIKPANKDELIQVLKTAIPKTAYQNPSLLGGLLSYGDIVILVTPIDIEAPDGRLILPQIQAIRDVLDNDCIAIVLKERELDVFLRKTAIEPKLVLTDSQVILKADASVPKHIPLTGFSVLLAHHKGDFEAYLEGTPRISELEDGDRILLLESCTHHVSCDDIGRVKIPRWISNFTGKKLEFDVVAGLDKVQRPMEDYALVIQCGGCMITRKQIHNRLKSAIDKHIPITNYGMAIAYVQGVYGRAIAPFVESDRTSTDYI